MGAAQREIDNFMKRDAWAKMKWLELPKGSNRWKSNGCSK
jgi:hypothetical protein